METKNKNHFLTHYFCRFRYIFIFVFLLKRRKLMRHFIRLIFQNGFVRFARWNAQGAKGAN